MNKILHTIAGSRHSKHSNDIPTTEGLEEVRQNANTIKDQLPTDILNAHIIGTDKNRTQVTAREIANTLGVPVGETKIKDFLNIKPQNSPAHIKEILKKIDVHYENDPSVKANGYSDELVYKIQRNALDDVDVTPFLKFTTHKLYQVIQAIKRTPDASNLTIAGIHGGRWLETVLYVLRGENMPKAWEGQLRMAEMFAMHVEKDTETGELSLIVNYRGESRSITETDMKAKIDALK